LSLPILRDVRQRTIADLTDFAVAYWDGRKLRYAFLRDDGSGTLDEEFNLEDYEWEGWQNDFNAWIAHPKFAVRPEVTQWLNELPPFEEE
jgi:hypothetical protein